MILGGPGLLDPCEKDPVDAASGLSNQEREDITASAQVKKPNNNSVINMTKN